MYLFIVFRLSSSQISLWYLGTFHLACRVSVGLVLCLNRRSWTFEDLSKDCGPADLHEEFGTHCGQQQKQYQRRCLEGGLARVRPSAAARVILAAAFLAQQAGVILWTATTDVVHARAAVLATQKLVVTHPGCSIERERVSRRHTHT